MACCFIRIDVVRVVFELGKWAFIKGRGKRLDGGVTEQALLDELARCGLGVHQIDIRVVGDEVHAEGNVSATREKEQIILLLGNVAGVSGVVDDIPSAEDPRFYTFVPGDTLARIAEDWLGCASRVQDLLDANYPVFTSSNQIGSGQTLVLPRM